MEIISTLKDKLGGITGKAGASLVGLLALLILLDFYFEFIPEMYLNYIKLAILAEVILILSGKSFVAFICYTFIKWNETKFRAKQAALGNFELSENEYDIQSIYSVASNLADALNSIKKESERQSALEDIKAELEEANEDDTN
jgi:hypothetical protein